MNPTTAEVGIGTASTTNPGEKLTIAGGNVLVDNARFYRGKSTGGVSISLIGVDANNAVSLHDGKVTLVGGGVLIDNNRFFKGKTTTGGSANLIGLDATNSVSIGNGSLAMNDTGNVGIGWVSPITKFYVFGSTVLDGPTRVKGGEFVVEGPMNVLSPVIAESGIQTTSLNKIGTGDINVDGGNMYAYNTAVYANYLQAHGGLFWDYLETTTMYVHGNLYLSGSIINNLAFVASVQAHPTDDSKQIVHAAVESGEVLTHVRGNARTLNGSLKIALPEDFSLVTSAESPVTVLLTAEGAPALLYVVSKSSEEIEVKMKSADFAEFEDVDFAYQVQGVKAGLEDSPAIQGVEVTALAKSSDAIASSPRRKALEDRQAALAARIRTAKGHPELRIGR